MPETATLLKKRPWHRCFHVNFAKFLRTPFLQNTSGWLPQKCSIKKVLLKSLLDSQACNFIKKETLTQVFSCEFCEISKSTFFQRTPLVTASVNSESSSLRCSGKYLFWNPEPLGWRRPSKTILLQILKFHQKHMCQGLFLRRHYKRDSSTDVFLWI